MNHHNGNNIIRITTSSSASTDVVINYALYTNLLEEFENLVNIASATDTDIDLGQDGKCQVNSLSVKNNDASVSNTITLSKRESSTNYVIFKTTLAAGEQITFDRGKGWTVFTTDGKIKVQVGSGGGGSTVWGDLTGTLSDQTDLQAALDAKENTITATTSADYYRGDKTFQTLDKTAVGLSNVVNADTTTTANITDSSNKRFMTDAQEAKVDFISVTQAVDLDQMETDIAALANGMVYKGDWDASAGTFPGSGTAQIGWFYYVTVAGTVDGIDFAIGDNIVAVVDNASATVYAANWSKHDQTDAVQSVAGLTGSISASGLRTALNVEDGADVTDAVNVGSSIHGATAKTTPVDADTMPLIDSAASNVLKKVTWANIKATIATYYNSLTATLTNKTLTSPVINSPTGIVKGDVGLGNVDNTSDSTKNSATATLTNKRITKRVGSTTSSATPTINTDNVDRYHLTAQAANITSFTTNLSGTPTSEQLLLISITGTDARTITWGASFAAGAVALPTTTVTTQRLDTLFKWSSVASKWMAMASGSYADS